MKQLVIAFVTMTTMAILPCSAQIKHKAAPVIDPLSSFKLIVERFNAFFAAGPRKLIEKQDFPHSSTGYIINIDDIIFQDLAYDVEKTASLVSPYAGTIQMNVILKNNGKCGDVMGPDIDLDKPPGAETPWGWSTVAGALSGDRLECYWACPLG